MNTNELNQKIDEALKEIEESKAVINKRQLDELRAEDAGEEITDFKDYNDALDKIKAKYDNDEILAYCPKGYIFFAVT